MNFLKKLLIKGKQEDKIQTSTESVNSTSIQTTQSFEDRYTEIRIEPKVLDGSFKMIESYFVDNKIEWKREMPLNHPINLDLIDQKGFGFVLYCKIFQMDEEQATLILAYAFSNFLIHKYGFKLYKDSKPEQPLRSITLKHDKGGLVFSLYPYEYTSKVLNGNETFSEKVDLINKFANSDN